MRLWKITVEIREKATGYRYPVVSHDFYGRTKKEALRYVVSHEKTDAFFSDCIRKGHWEEVDCRSAVAFSGWVDY